MAFVSSFLPAFTRSTAISGAKVCSSVRTTTSKSSTVTMVTEKSPSVPFMEVPNALSPDMAGYAGFDPLNISSYLNVKWLQEAEIKHGRICMLAILGLMMAEVYTFPFYSGTAAPHIAIYRHNWGVTNGSLAQILLWSSFFEIMTTPAVIQMINGKSDRAPGDFKFDPLGLGKNADKLAVYKTNEIKNGRLAMVAVSGAIHHAAITQQNLFEQLFAGNVIPNPPTF